MDDQIAELRGLVERLLNAKAASVNDATIQFMNGEIAAQVPALLSRIDALTEALRPFARLRLSTEGEVSDCVLRSPAEEMRLQAFSIEKRDAEILRARSTLAGADGEGK